MVNDQWRTPTLVEDLAIGCKLVTDKRAEGIYHISGGEGFTPYDLAVATADYFNLDKSLISATNASEFKEIGTRPPKTGFDISKIMSLGFEPRSIREGLRILESQLA